MIRWWQIISFEWKFLLLFFFFFFFKLQTFLIIISFHSLEIYSDYYFSENNYVHWYVTISWIYSVLRTRIIHFGKLIIYVTSSWLIIYANCSTVLILYVICSTKLIIHTPLSPIVQSFIPLVWLYFNLFYLFSHIWISISYLTGYLTIY